MHFFLFQKKLSLKNFNGSLFLVFHGPLIDVIINARSKLIWYMYFIRMCDHLCICAQYMQAVYKYFVCEHLSKEECHKPREVLKNPVDSTCGLYFLFY